MTPAEMLADAEMKLHQLVTGRLAVKVVIEGQETEFTRANVSELRRYIGELRSRVAGVPTHGAIGLVF